MRIEYHRTLVADHVRNAAFAEALAAVITPGVTTVADVGAGTGLLGLIAAKLGAKEVFLYETAEVAGVAAQLLKANRARNCHLFPCHSTEMQDPPRVDVVVSETLGNYALEENIIDTLNDARARFLRPGGVVIPSRIAQFVAPVVVPRLDEELRVWDRIGHGLDFSFARTMSLNNAYVRTLAPRDLLDPAGVQWDVVDLAKQARGTRKGEASWKPKSAVTAYGFAVWWEADLGAGVRMSTAPGSPRTHWEQLYFPLLEPIAVAPGETLTVALRSRSSEEAGTHLAWTAGRLDKTGKQSARQALDLDKGFLP